MLKKVITIIMLGLIGVSCVSCGKEKVSLRDTVTNLQKAGASSIKNSGISIELVDSKGKATLLGQGLASLQTWKKKRHFVIREVQSILR